MHLLQEGLHANRQRRKAPIETNHENSAWRSWIVIRLRDSAEFLFVEAERLFAEDMLAGVKRCDHLFGVQVVTRGNYYCVDRRIAKNLLLIRGAGTKSKF